MLFSPSPNHNKGYDDDLLTDSLSSAIIFQSTDQLVLQM